MRQAQGQLNPVTNGRFQVSAFNDSFPAMNLKSKRLPGDRHLTDKISFAVTGMDK